MITNAIVIKVNLVGTINTRIRKEPQRVGFRKGLNNDGKLVEMPIYHSDATVNEAYRRTNISSEVVEFWQSLAGNTVGISPSLWKKMTPIYRLNQHIKSFDEGFGVSYELI